jgi:hypothetical protein
MPGYIKMLLLMYKHKMLSKPQHCPLLPLNNMVPKLMLLFPLTSPQSYPTCSGGPEHYFNDPWDKQEELIINLLNNINVVNASRRLIP